MCVERSVGAPSSWLRGFIEALTFCRHVLGVAEFDRVTTSRRCQGVAALDADQKLEQSEPRSVKQMAYCTVFLFKTMKFGTELLLVCCCFACKHAQDGPTLSMVRNY